jgi:hypothetical protein
MTKLEIAVERLVSSGLNELQAQEIAALILENQPSQQHELSAHELDYKISTLKRGFLKWYLVSKAIIAMVFIGCLWLAFKVLGF